MTTWAVMRFRKRVGDPGNDVRSRRRVRRQCDERGIAFLHRRDSPRDLTRETENRAAIEPRVGTKHSVLHCRGETLRLVEVGYALRGVGHPQQPADPVQEPPTLLLVLGIPL